MHRNLQLGLVGVLVVTVAAVLVVTMLTGDDPPASQDGTPTIGPTATGAVPSATGTARPTDTPVPPTPTPTPEPPIGAAQAMALLVSETDATPGDLTLVSYERATWPDQSLDCPEPGVAYSQVETPGWRIIIDDRGTQIEFHSDESAGILINCTEREAALEGTVNVFELEGLEGTTLIEFERFDFEEQVYNKINEESAEQEIQDFLTVLDTPIETNTSDGCQAVFRLIFHTPDGEVPIETICGSNTRMVRGPATGWNSEDGIAPTQLGTLVGRYIPDSGIPTFPAD